jgi:hypothetical protein
VRCAWYVPNEDAVAWYRLPCVYAINAAVSQSIVTKTGKRLAEREIWSGVLNGIDWRMTPEERMHVARVMWASLEPPLRARLAAGLPPPELFVYEAQVFAWLSENLIWRGGFLRPNGKMKAVAKWAPALPAEVRWLIDQWIAAGGGPPTVSPYLFTMVTDVQDVVISPDSGTWLKNAARVDPEFFPDGYEWPPHPTSEAVDYPNSIAFRLARMGFARWVKRLKLECPDCRVVPQLSNGNYRDLEDDPASVWLERMAEQIPGILRNNGFPPAIQVELFRGNLATPSAECRAMELASADPGTEVSVFDSIKARATIGGCP